MIMDAVLAHIFAAILLLLSLWAILRAAIALHNSISGQDVAPGEESVVSDDETARPWQ